MIPLGSHGCRDRFGFLQTFVDLHAVLARFLDLPFSAVPEFSVHTRCRRLPVPFT